jgi:hypothetical protein
MAEFIDEESCLDVMREIGTEEEGIAYMKDKCAFRRILIKDVRNAIANIIKQEMLSIGGEVAVNKGCVNCSVEKSDILVMGTVKQINKLIRKMKVQVSESKSIAEEMQSLIKS